MKDETVDALHRINREFYDSHALTFSASRSCPWMGWGRAAQPVVDRWSNADRHQSPSILDVGCGNGRFAEFLADRLHPPVRYIGLDGSIRLLGLASQRVRRLRGVQASFVATDLIAGSIPSRPAGYAFDVIVLFGVLHHLAGFSNRRTLLQSLATALRPGGQLIVSFWRFGADDRFRHRLIDWRVHCRQTGQDIDLEDLETGDELLAWGPLDPEGLGDPSRSTPRRYCHFADDNEVDSLLLDLDLRIQDRFRSDGRGGELNLYVVMERTESTVYGRE